MRVEIQGGRQLHAKMFQEMLSITSLCWELVSAICSLLKCPWNVFPQFPHRTEEVQKESQQIEYAHIMHLHTCSEIQKKQRFVMLTVRIVKLMQELTGEIQTSLINTAQKT